MGEAEVTYDAHGIWDVQVDGEKVHIAELAKAWTRREETKRLHASMDAVIEQRDAANALVEKLKGHLSTRSRERDAAVAKMTRLDTRQVAQVERLVKERDKAVADLKSWLEATHAMEARRDEPRKRMWLVSRTDAAGKPGEYGNVVVWAHDACDAIDVVMWAGWNGKPLYGYRDRDHTIAVPLAGTRTCDGADAVVIAETLR